MIKSGKQFTFDLDTNKLKEVLGEKGYTKAYNELYDYFCNDRGFEHRQGSVYCTHKLMNDYDVWKMSCELQKKCPWITSALTRMDVTNIGTTHEVTEWVISSMEGSKRKENIFGIFEKEIIDSGFKPSKSVMENYLKIVEDRDEIMTLEDISAEYHSGSTDELINAIGDELKAQELQHISEMSDTPEI